MVAGRQSAGRFLLRVDGRVDLAAESLLDLAKLHREFGQANPAHDEKIDVAAGRLLAARDRAVDRCESDGLPVRSEQVAKHVDQTHRLEEETPKVIQERTSGLSTVVDPPTIGPAREDAGRAKCGDLALEARRTEAQVSGQVTQVPPALGLEQGRSQHALASARHQCIDGTVHAHVAYNYTQDA